MLFPLLVGVAAGVAIQRYILADEENRIHEIFDGFDRYYNKGMLMGVQELIYKMSQTEKVIELMGYTKALKEKFEKNIDSYSEGQKKKVLIAKSICEQANIYIWDEPLNYIDIYSRMQIEALIKKYNQPEEENNTPIGVIEVSGIENSAISEIPFTKESGVCKVKCKINGLPLHFVFDTGASDVTLSMVEATFMMKNDYLSGNDVVGSQRYMDANGDVTVGTVINLKEVTFGEHSLKNVRASVVRNQKAPLLLGQSVLGRLGKIEIDNSKNVIRITHNKY